MIEIKHVLPLATTLDQPIKSVKYLAIHCSATTPSMDWGVKDIDIEHRKRGFLRIGYHYVIRRDGSIEKGREDNQAGAHVAGFNSVSLGICMIGGVNKTTDVNRNVNGAVASLVPADNFTEAQFTSLLILLQELKKTYPKATIQGHRDFPKVAKACPSFDVKEFVKKHKL